MSKQAMLVKKGEGEELSVMGAQVRFLCESGQTGQAWSLMETTLPKDAGPPLHQHPWDEAYFVVEGEVRFTIQDQPQVVRAGDFVYAPGGTPHAFQGLSEQPARVLIFDAPAHAESFFKEVHREVKGPEDMAKVPAIGDRHQIHFMRP